MTRKNFIGLYALYAVLGEYRQATDPSEAISPIEPNLAVSQGVADAREKLATALCMGKATRLEHARELYGVTIEEVADVIIRLKAALRQE